MLSDINVHINEHTLFCHLPSEEGSLQAGLTSQEW